MQAQATSKVKMASLDAKVIRKDGTVEDLGTIAYFHKNPLKRWAWRIKHECQRIASGIRTLTN